MAGVLDYADGSLPVRRTGLAAAGILVTGVAGAALAVYLAAGMDAYFHTFGGCATGRSEALFQLRVGAGGACMFPATAVGLSRRFPVGGVTCRASLWAALTAWLGACLIVSRW